jgi:hypothetical protein
VAVHDAQRAVGHGPSVHPLEGAVEERERDHSGAQGSAGAGVKGGQIRAGGCHQCCAPQFVVGLPPGRRVDGGRRGGAVETLEVRQRQHAVVEHAGAHERLDRAQDFG